MDYTALKDDLMEFQKINPSADAPYHNNNHMSVMTDIAAGIYLKEVNIVDKHDLAVIITAGMLHDFGHSAGRLSDNDNIGLALEGYDLYKQDHGKIEATAREEFDHDVRKAIICTEFPFVHEPQTLPEECLRDADILYACMTQDPELILTELRKEIEVSMGEKVSRQDMFEGQKAFFDKARLYTRTGQELWDNHAAKFIKKMEKALKA